MQKLATRFREIHGKARPIVAICLFGLAASLASVGFQLAINWLYKLCYQNQASGSFLRFAGISLAVIVVTSLISGWLLNSFCPEAAGSGIPQAKLAFWKEFGFSPKRTAWIKFLAGVLSIGGGQSLGREGPSVQLGSNLASTVAGLLGIPKHNRRAANAAGSAAGLAAAFNAPLASVAFVLEEVIGDLNSSFIGGILLAAVIGAFVVHAFIGPQPAFELSRIDEPTWRAYLLMPIAAAVAALVGVYFQRLCLDLRAKSSKYRVIPKWLHPLGGGLATWVLGIAVFAMTGRLGVFSLGYDDLTDALTHGMAWHIAALLLVGKLVATIVSYGLGGCGGIFSPNLFFGAMCGICVGGAGSMIFPLTPADQVLLAVGGMSACLGAVVQAPVTAILIIFEMTHQFALIPGLMLAGLVSQVIARSMNHSNFYEAVLLQDGHQLEHIIPPRDLRSWQNLPISAIANFTPIMIEDRSEGALRDMLAQHPYRYFPIVESGRLKGVVARAEVEASLCEHRPVRLMPAITSRPGEIIREMQDRFIESSTGFIILSDSPVGNVLAVVTLHDVLRAQVAMSERENGE
ncbi:MAG: chloride channel protein [Verrucomicrobiota bacterium]